MHADVFQISNCDLCSRASVLALGRLRESACQTRGRIAGAAADRDQAGICILYEAGGAAFGAKPKPLTGFVDGDLLGESRRSPGSSFVRC